VTHQPGSAPDEFTWVAAIHTATPSVEGSVFADPRFPQHAAFLRRMREAGHLVAAGPLADTPAEGMTVLRLPGTGRLEDARALLESDESVVAGLFTVQVRPWAVVMSADGL
jgi:uncharacterized protein YciI